jgi:hypothetical protein
MPRQLENMNRLPCVVFSTVERVQWLAQVAGPARARLLYAVMDAYCLHLICSHAFNLTLMPVLSAEHYAGDGRISPVAGGQAQGAELAF